MAEKTFKVKLAIDEGLPDTIREALRTKEDTMIIAKSSRTLVYVGSKEKIDPRVNREYCESHGIQYAEFLVTRPNSEFDNAFLSVEGNCSIVCVVRKPIEPIAFSEVLHNALRRTMKDFYGVDTFLDNGDCVCGNACIIGNLKLMSSPVFNEYADMYVVAIGVSLKFNEFLHPFVFPATKRHGSQKTPSSLEFVTKKEIDSLEFVANFIKTFEGTTPYKVEE